MILIGIVTAGYIVGIVALILAIRHINRRTARWKRGECLACGYPLGGAATCPECGKPHRVVTMREWRRRP